MPEFSIEYNIQEPAWQEVITTAWLDMERKLFAAAWQAGLNRIQQFSPLPSQINHSISFTDANHIQHLNASFRQLDKSTNILSFPATALSTLQPDLTQIVQANPELLELGDLVLSYQNCTNELHDPEHYDISSGPTEFNQLQWYTLRLCVHGMLHLLGFDHEQETDAIQMETTEASILATVGIILLA